MLISLFIIPLIGAFFLLIVENKSTEFFVILPLIIVSFILSIFPNVVLDSLHLAVSSLLIGLNTPNGSEILVTFMPGVFLYKEVNTKDTKAPLIKVEENTKQNLDPF